MPVAKVVAALEVEVISWRMGACVTMAVEVGVGAGATVGAGRAGLAEEKKGKMARFRIKWEASLRFSIKQHSVLLYSSATYSQLKDAKT